VLKRVVCDNKMAFFPPHAIEFKGGLRFP
jgi:hypothetical protein